MLKLRIFILAFLHLGCHGLHSDMPFLARCRTIIQDERLCLHKKVDSTCLKQVRGGAEVDDNVEVPKNKVVQLYSSYMKSLDKHPVRTKSITAGIVLAVGDLLAQSIESSVAKKPSFIVNWTRLNAFLLTGALYVGPFVHYWFELLWMMGRWLERNHDVSKGWQTMTQLFTDQTIGILFFFPPYFYVYELFEAFVGLRVRHAHVIACTHNHVVNHSPLSCISAAFYACYYKGQGRNMGFIHDELSDLAHYKLAELYLCARKSSGVDK
eukprot:scaffold56163_cov41-Attheya_sp.AAC.1